MSLIGQVSTIPRITRPIEGAKQVSLYVKGHTYDVVHRQFERPQDALGNRYRNPVSRTYDYVVGLFGRFISVFRRVEITIRIKQQ